MFGVNQITFSLIDSLSHTAFGAAILSHQWSSLPGPRLPPRKSRKLSLSNAMHERAKHRRLFLQRRGPPCSTTAMGENFVQASSMAYLGHGLSLSPRTTSSKIRMPLLRSCTGLLENSLLGVLERLHGNAAGENKWTMFV